MARQKITEPHDAFADLTEKQQDFVICLATGMTQIAAYKKAFAPPNTSDAAIRVDACRLAARPNVLLILDNLASEKLDAAKVTLKGHTQELARLAKRAEAAGNYGAAVQAEQLRGKAAGLYVEKHADVTDRDPMDALNELAMISPDLARAVAEQQGIKWEPDDTKH